METRSHAPRQYPPKPGNAYLFATCLIDQFAPEAGLDTVRLLEREGIAIHFPLDQTCCGQPPIPVAIPTRRALSPGVSSTCSPNPGRSSCPRVPAPR